MQIITSLFINVKQSTQILFSRLEDCRTALSHLKNLLKNMKKGRLMLYLIITKNYNRAETQLMKPKMKVKII